MHLGGHLKTGRRIRANHFRFQLIERNAVDAQQALVRLRVPARFRSRGLRQRPSSQSEHRCFAFSSLPSRPIAAIATMTATAILVPSVRTNICMSRLGLLAKFRLFSFLATDHVMCGVEVI